MSPPPRSTSTRRRGPRHRSRAACSRSPASACAAGPVADSGDDVMTGSLDRKLWGALPDGTPVEQFTLRNERGMTAVVITYGAILASLRVPDRSGALDNVVLGYAGLPEYLGDDASFGATVGRYANRIAGGRFAIDGTTYELPRNNGPNSLHGGVKGFSKRVWQAGGAV